MTFNKSMLLTGSVLFVIIAIVYPFLLVEKLCYYGFEQSWLSYHRNEQGLVWMLAWE